MSVLFERYVTCYQHTQQSSLLHTDTEVPSRVSAVASFHMDSISAAPDGLTTVPSKLPRGNRGASRHGLYVKHSSVGDLSFH